MVCQTIKTKVTVMLCLLISCKVFILWKILNNLIHKTPSQTRVPHANGETYSELL